MKELAPFSTGIHPARKWSPEDERRLGQIMQRLADDLIEKAKLLRSFCSESRAEGEVNHPVLSCDANNCPYRRRFKKIISDTVEELEKTRKSFKSKRLEALRKKLCRELVRM